MKAKAQYSEFDLEKERSRKAKEFQETLANLEKEQKLVKRIKKINFPCEVRYWVSVGNSYRSIQFHAPVGGWQEDKMFHLTLAKLVRVFKVRFDRKFSESSGSYYWVGKTKKGIEIVLYDAVKPDNCVIVPVREAVTKYKSVCGEEKEKLEVTKNG